MINNNFQAITVIFLATAIGLIAGCLVIRIVEISKRVLISLNGVR